MNADFTTSLGAVAGRDLGDLVHVAGLPYAAAPVGANRFALPQPPEGWSGVRAFTQGAPVPPQFPSRLAAVMGDYPAEQSEDCLKLEIWAHRAPAQGRPVIVFIHGGAFMTGGGAMACYDGASLARASGAVVVTLSYRLGALGFMPIDGLAPANLGLHDQIAALRFIRQEIGAFGGDAGNVTVIGQSAGGLSIAAMLTLPDAAALFDKAVLISAPLGLELNTTAQAAGLGQAFLGALGLADPAPGALAGLSTAQILQAQGAVMRQWVQAGAPDQITPPFMPVIDGVLLHDQPQRSLMNRPPVWCPLILGATREEMASFWFDRQDLEDHARAVLPARFEEAFPGRGAAMMAQFQARRADPAALAVLGDLRTSVDFVWPALDLAQRQTEAGGDGFAYVFDWQSPDRRMGACHCIELAFLLGEPAVWEGAPMLAGAAPTELAGLRARFQASIGAFARTGRPDTDLSWPASRDWGAAMHFDRLSGWNTPQPGARA